MLVKKQSLLGKVIPIQSNSVLKMTEVSKQWHSTTIDISQNIITVNKIMYLAVDIAYFILSASMLSVLFVIHVFTMYFTKQKYHWDLC